MLAIVLAPSGWRVPVTVLTVLPALAVTGAVGAYLGQSPPARPAVRVVVGGALALAGTFGVGRLLGTTGIV
jgi:VIT1/CCC1 family predicted Fe2+/Mn2+ transporter